MTADGRRAVYLVRGDDPSLVADAARRLIDELVGGGDHGLVVETFEAGPESGAGPVIDACLTPPFLTDQRVVVVREVGAWAAEDAERVAEYLTDPLDTTTLVLVGGGGSPGQKLTAAVKKAGAVIDTGPPERGGASARSSWLADYLATAPVDLDAPAVKALQAHLGEDAGRLPGILATLAGAYGTGARVGLAELEPFLGEAGGVAPWDLTDAVDRGDYEAALVALHRLLEGGARHPLVVLATLHRHVANLVRLDGAGVRSDTEAAEVLGMKGSTFPAKKALAQARRLGSSRVLRAAELVADADIDLRGGREWPGHLVLEVLVARLCQLSAAGGRRSR